MNVSQASGERLALLYRLSQTFNSSLDLDEVLHRVMDEVITAVRAERGFVMLPDDTGELMFRVARGIDQQTIDAPEFHISRGLVERVAGEGQPLLTSDAQSDDRLSMRRSVLNLGLRSILCVPLIIKNHVFGVIYVDNRLQAGIFTPDDLELLTSIAATAAIAIENARLYQVAVEKGRLERELQVAREVQTSLLPRQTPQIAGWEFVARWQPARQVAGDFYDFIHLTEDDLGLIIADVSDKGMPAALFMAMTRSIVRASVTQAPPSEAISQANRLIHADATNGMFVSLFFARLNLTTGQMIYVNAGHNPPWLYRAAEDHWRPLDRTGMVLGIDPTHQFTSGTAQLDPGDFILLYTDGVTDATNAVGDEFGLQRMLRLVWPERHGPAAKMMAALEADLHAFVGQAAPFDDVTLVIAKR